MRNLKTKTEFENIVRKSQTLKSQLYSMLLKSDGILVNIIVALVHWAMILAVPILCPLISFYALTLRTPL